MKRLICLLLVAVCASSFAVAEDIDFSTMAIEELLMLRSNLNAELARRNFEDMVFIPAGRYLVGTDIAPGRYILTTYQADKSFALSDVFVYQPGVTPESYAKIATEYYIEYDRLLEAYKNKEIDVAPERLDKDKYIAVEERGIYEKVQFAVSLEEGQLLVIDFNGEALMTIEKGKTLFMGE